MVWYPDDIHQWHHVCKQVHDRSTTITQESDLDQSNDTQTGCTSIKIQNK